MFYLFGALTSSIVFAQSYKFAVAKKYDVDWVSAVSFMMSAVLLVASQIGRPLSINSHTLLLGVFYGLVGGGAQITYFRALKYGDISVSWTIVQLSTLIPVGASIVFWHEVPSIIQAAAIGGMALSIMLMGNMEIKLVQDPRAWAGWLGLSFLASGLSGVCMKVLESLESGRSETTFLLTGYLVSVLFTIPLIRNRRSGRLEWIAGSVRGLAILLANYLLLQAIRLLPGYLVFSVYSAAGVSVNAILAILVWRERPKFDALAGILVAVLSLILFNIKI